MLHGSWRLPVVAAAVWLSAGLPLHARPPHKQALADHFGPFLARTLHDCRTCHLLRGLVHQNDIDFTGWDKFLGYEDRVEELVFDEGLMPLATLTFDNFHDEANLNFASLPYGPDTFLGDVRQQLGGPWVEVTGNYRAVGLATANGGLAHAILNGLSETNVSVQAALALTPNSTQFAAVTGAADQRRMS